MKSSHFFDLDVLIDVKSKVWVVSRTNPKVPIIKIPKSEFNLIRKGIYRKYNQSIKIGGDSYWISEDLMNSLKIRCKNLKQDISDLSFSMQEFMNKEIIENVDFDILINNFQHLKNSGDDIYIICSKNNKKNYEIIIKKLEDKFLELGVQVKNFYYLSETFYNRDNDDISHKKVRLLLQHLIGYKTEGDKFIDDVIEEYDTINFYDDEVSTIALSIDSGKMFEFIISNTDDVLKSIIKENIKHTEKKIVVNQITNNSVNKFIKKDVIIRWSNIKTFENFIYRLK